MAFQIIARMDAISINVNYQHDYSFLAVSGPSLRSAYAQYSDCCNKQKHIEELQTQTTLFAFRPRAQTLQRSLRHTYLLQTGSPSTPTTQTLESPPQPRYPSPVAVNPATGRRGPLMQKALQRPTTTNCRRFFCACFLCNGGCAWETFGSAEFLLPRSANPRTAATPFASRRTLAAPMQEEHHNE